MKKLLAETLENYYNGKYDAATQNLGMIGYAPTGVAFLNRYERSRFMHCLDIIASTDEQLTADEVLQLMRETA